MTYFLEWVEVAVTVDVSNPQDTYQNKLAIRMYYRLPSHISHVREQ